jgi:hypothetical protein
VTLLDPSVADDPLRLHLRGAAGLDRLAIIHPPGGVASPR